jgi:macrolide-specific efflux system membrane fusion protein
MKMYKTIPVAILITVLGILSLSCKAKTDSATANQVAVVQRGNLNINILASGNLKTAHEENMAFYSSGTVAEVLVKVGDHVEAGTVLAKLDTAPLESSLAQAKINVASAQMNLENAETPKTNSSGTQVISAPDPLDIEIKQLQLDNAKANLAEAQKTLQKATIVAPFAGLVTDVNVVPGDQVSANAVGVRIIDPVNFQTDVLVNEMEIYQLSIGTPATVEVVAQSGYSFPARVALIAESPTIQSNVVNYNVTVQMDPVGTTISQNQTTPRIPRGTTAQFSDNQTAPYNRTASDNQTSGQQYTRRPFSGQTSTAASQGQLGRQQSQTTTALPAGFRLREGLTVTVSIITDEKTNILLVPNRAITSRAGKYYVQVVSSPGVTEERMIQAGITDGQNTEVISGLNEGDQVSIANNAATSTTTSTSTQQRTQTPGFPGGVRIPGVTR